MRDGRWSKSSDEIFSGRTQWLTDLIELAPDMAAASGHVKEERNLERTAHQRIPFLGTRNTHKARMAFGHHVFHEPMVGESLLQRPVDEGQAPRTWCLPAHDVFHWLDPGRSGKNGAAHGRSRIIASGVLIPPSLQQLWTGCIRHNLVEVREGTTSTQAQVPRNCSFPWKPVGLRRCHRRVHGHTCTTVTSGTGTQNLTCARHQFLPRSLQPSNSRCPNSFYTPSFSLSLSLAKQRQIPEDHQTCTDPKQQSNKLMITKALIFP